MKTDEFKNFNFNKNGVVNTAATIPPCLSGIPHTGEVFLYSITLGESSQIQKKRGWTEPHEDYSDSGNHNPLDSIEEIILASINDGQDFYKAISPIRYLCYKFNLICCELPSNNKSVKSTCSELMKAIKEFGKLCDSVGKALEDMRITKFELSEIENKGLNLISQIMILIKQAEKEVK